MSHRDTGRLQAMGLAGLIGAAIGFALLAGLMLSATGGVAQYPLDDVYIHLAMAEQLLRGNYGVNTGELASAGSSPLYTLLLVPLAGTPWHPVVPLLWNVAALLLSAWIFARILWWAGIEGPFGLAVAALAPLCLNMVGLATAGMEHTVHLALALVTFWGVVRWQETGRLEPWLWAAVTLAPLLRPEALSLSLTAALAVAVGGALRAGAGLAVLSIAPLGAFILILKLLGLSALPNSVAAKLALGQAMTAGPLAQASVNLTSTAGQILACLAALAALALGTARGRALWPLVAITVLPLLAHLGVGQVGWYNRYESYALALGAAGVVALWAPLIGQVPRRALASLAVVGLVGWFYVSDMAVRAPASARGVHLQQAQMARFAQEFVRAPVAVNDLGLVSYRNPAYVLDLYGLANRQALTIRLSDPEPGWAAPLVRAHGASLAMIYDDWIGDAVADEWIRLGALRFDGETGVLGSDTVTFYATRPETAQPLRDLLRRFAPTLPEGARFEMAPPPPAANRKATL